MMEQWKNILAFNRSERRGIFILIILLLTGFTINTCIRNIHNDALTIKTEVILAECGADNYFEKNNFRRKKYSERNTVQKDSLFFFDPNTITPGGWQQLGLSEKQAAVISRYVVNGGRFRQKEDLKRSFVISEDFYSKVEPWIKIELPQHEVNVARHQKELSGKTSIKAINLNMADTSELTGLRGIGAVLAKRIVKYREALGGFHSLQQLSEVYGISPEVVEINNEAIVVDRNEIIPVNINLASQKALSAHPYINKRLAYIITAIRKESGIKSNDDLISRLPSGTEINPNLWPYLKY